MKQHKEHTLIKEESLKQLHDTPLYHYIIILERLLYVLYNVNCKMHNIV